MHGRKGAHIGKKRPSPQSLYPNLPKEYQGLFYIPPEKKQERNFPKIKDPELQRIFQILLRDLFLDISFFATPTYSPFTPTRPFFDLLPPQLRFFLLSQFTQNLLLIESPDTLNRSFPHTFENIMIFFYLFSILSDKVSWEMEEKIDRIDRDFEKYVATVEQTCVNNAKDCGSVACCNHGCCGCGYGCSCGGIISDFAFGSNLYQPRHLKVANICLKKRDEKILKQSRKRRKRSDFSSTSSVMPSSSSSNNNNPIVSLNQNVKAEAMLEITALESMLDYAKTQCQSGNGTKDAWTREKHISLWYRGDEEENLRIHPFSGPLSVPEKVKFECTFGVFHDCYPESSHLGEEMEFPTSVRDFQISTSIKDSIPNRKEDLFFYRKIVSVLFQKLFPRIADLPTFKTLHFVFCKPFWSFLIACIKKVFFEYICDLKEYHKLWSLFSDRVSVENSELLDFLLVWTKRVTDQFVRENMSLNIDAKYLMPLNIFELEAMLAMNSLFIGKKKQKKIKTLRDRLNLRRKDRDLKEKEKRILQKKPENEQEESKITSESEEKSEDQEILLLEDQKKLENETENELAEQEKKDFDAQQTKDAQDAQDSQHQHHNNKRIQNIVTDNEENMLELYNFLLNYYSSIQSFSSIESRYNCAYKTFQNFIKTHESEESEENEDHEQEPTHTQTEAIQIQEQNPENQIQEQNPENQIQEQNPENEEKIKNSCQTQTEICKELEQEQENAVVDEKEKEVSISASNSSVSSSSSSSSSPIKSLCYSLMSIGFRGLNQISYQIYENFPPTKWRKTLFAIYYEPICANCGCRMNKKLVCSACNLETYCSRECQAKQWKNHKQICGKLKKDWERLEKDMEENSKLFELTKKKIEKKKKQFSNALTAVKDLMGL